MQKGLPSGSLDLQDHSTDVASCSSCCLMDGLRLRSGQLPVCRTSLEDEGEEDGQRCHWSFLSSGLPVASGRRGGRMMDG